MKGLTIYSTFKQDDCKYLISICNSFCFLDNYKSEEKRQSVWYSSETGEKHQRLNIVFIGKTGYGKSSTLNAIFKKNLFDTSDVEACTSRIECAEFKITNNDLKSDSLKTVISFCDMPGIGEAYIGNEDRNPKFLEMYEGMIKESVLVVYFLNADQRDYAEDLKLFSRCFPQKLDRNNLLIALNKVDKIEPINRKSDTLNKQQLANIEQKRLNISKIFDVRYSDIVAYSVATGYYIKALTEKIANKLCTSLDIDKPKNENEIKLMIKERIANKFYLRSISSQDHLNQLSNTRFWHFIYELKQELNCKVNNNDIERCITVGDLINVFYKSKTW